MRAVISCKHQKGGGGGVGQITPKTKTGAYNLIGGLAEGAPETGKTRKRKPGDHVLRDNEKGKNTDGGRVIAVRNPTFRGRNQSVLCR